MRRPVKAQVRAVVARNLCEHSLLRRTSHALPELIPVLAKSRPPESRRVDLKVGFVGFDAGQRTATGRSRPSGGSRRPAAVRPTADIQLGYDNAHAVKPPKQFKFAGQRLSYSRKHSNEDHRHRRDAPGAIPGEVTPTGTDARSSGWQPT